MHTPLQSITDIVLLGFSLILLPGMSIPCHTIIYFFVKNFFSNVYILVDAIFKCSYSSFGWDIGHPVSIYVTKIIQNVYRCAQGVWGITLHVYVCTYLFSCFFLMVSCFNLYKLNLTFIQKGCVCQKWLFFSNEINFCWNEISFCYFKLFFRTKLNQNGFNFNQIS